jgi:hypothetical protein
MARKAALFGILALSAFMVFAQDRRGGLVEGDNWAFLVSAPEGWVWDSTSLRHQGIWGLFYREGKQFSPAGLHIYINPVQKRPGGPTSLPGFIEADEATYMKANPGNRITDLPPYAPGLDYQFALRDFDDSGEGYYQSLAYYEGEDVFLVFVLFCRSAVERDGARAAFLELLDSFTYIHKD